MQSNSTTTKAMSEITDELARLQARHTAVQSVINNQRAFYSLELAAGNYARTLRIATSLDKREQELRHLTARIQMLEDEQHQNHLATFDWQPAPSIHNRTQNPSGLSFLFNPHQARRYVKQQPDLSFAAWLEGTDESEQMQQRSKL